jgi:hypothetical protein
MASINATSVIVVGGYSNGTACSKSTYILDVESGIWKEGPELQVGRVDVLCGSIRNSAVGCNLFWGGVGAGIEHLIVSL